MNERVGIDPLERRQLFAWSAAAQLVNLDDAVTNHASVTGQGVTVVVIDTGINYKRSELGGGFGKGRKVVGGYDFHDDDADPMDTDGHGTQVASVIAASPYTTGGITHRGVAPDAKLVALRVGTADSIPDANIERALRWVIDNYRAFGISIVNLSLGSGAYPDARTESRFSDELEALHEIGVFVVAASGNSNDYSSGPISQDGIAFPAADPSVFAVGAVTSGDLITSWSQRGDELDLLAPGDDIVVPQLLSGYTTVDGTSFASPYVAGAAALVKQIDPKARAGDLGSILMSSGTPNRDGDPETGNTTALLFSRLNIDSALAMATRRIGRTPTLALGKTFDTALDSQGVLHASVYDTRTGRLLYATRNTSGLWSRTYVVDASADVGVQSSIAVDNAGQVGIAYFDLTNTAIKYATFDGARWSTVVIESDRHVGTFPSLAYDIDGNPYIAYYRRSGGRLMLATQDRDSGVWSRLTVDGGNGVDVGAYVSLDAGEAAFRSGPFTTYDTTVAMAYADITGGNLKYARIDLDAIGAEAGWKIATVADTAGVAHIAFDLHDGPLGLGLQAQIAYVDVASRQVRYAYKNNTWFTEGVATIGRVGGSVQMTFTELDAPVISYFHGTNRAVYNATRSVSGTWSSLRIGAGSGAIAVGLNDREDAVLLTFLNRARNEVLTRSLV